MVAKVVGWHSLLDMQQGYGTLLDPGENTTYYAVAWDDSVYSQEDSKEFYAAVKEDLAEGQVIYACVVEGSKGKLTIGAKPVNALGNVYAQVVKAYTNADGTLAFMFEFINKPTTV